MKLRHLIAMFVFASALVGSTACSSFSPMLKKGEAIPEGKVLIIGKITVDPPMYKPGERPDPDEHQAVVLIGLTNDLSKPYVEGEFNVPDEALDPFPEDLFYALLSPGVRYIRYGQVRKPVVFLGHAEFEVINFYRNIKLEIPARAKAVYIGTIQYKRNGKKALSVSVRDDYEQAMREFAAMKVPGVKPGDVVKRIGVLMK
jgi:hypothetical protein